ncbi:MAG: hypothetical protein KC466_15910, partial [Myxococcales bacterium]|nr:hypothetical protein [Myxococcales bacterium]
EDAAIAVAACDEAAPPARVVWDRLNPQGPEPVPSDWFAVDDPGTPTGKRLRLVAGENVPADHFLARYFAFALDDLADLDGWGVSASAQVPMTAPMDPIASGAVPEETSFPHKRPRWVFGPDGALFYLRLHDGARFGAIVDILGPEDGGMLIVEPLAPLDPQTEYALVLTKGLVGEPAAAGPQCVRPSTAYERVLDDAQAASPKEKVLQDFERDALARVRVADRRVHADNIDLALVFTTQSTVSQMAQARAQVTARPAPRIAPGSMAVETLDDGPVAVEVTGKFPALDLRGAERHWTRDPVTGAYEEKGEIDLDFLLQIPRETAEYHQPFPLAIFLHGLGEDRTAARKAANLMGGAGFATLSIDAVAHRGDGPSLLKVLDFFNVAGIFGKQPGAALVIRDNFRQSTIDQLQALALGLRLAREGFDEAEPLGVPDLDPEVPVGVIGSSLGGIMGNALAAMAPETGYALLFVGGGGVTRVVWESDEFAPILPVAIALAAPGAEVTDALIQGFFAFAQTIIDASDPIAFAGHIARAPLTAEIPGSHAKSVLLAEGIGDETIPNSSTEALARALGVPLTDPRADAVSDVPEAGSPLADNVAPGITGAYVQYREYRNRPGDDPHPAGHDVFGRYEPTIQAERFLASYYAGWRHERGPEVIDPFEAAGE